ncbi:putative beta-tubulin cofactor D [Toxoplasma gondii GT1]|uniref:Putative beta-tubulin cofactor D n=4 Tax=Toxoplasma gondii TaxID=5811 RepID=S7UKY2_TOXGG|nr:putative beta-tubulin cofactor D [Toxoplasma gondii GT1]KAF4645741.1 putative beta-tubulin cofactor D [Toxoplasma gondii]KFG39867.1 putative beta-tubulin cofactor D [Toxoplasma gondii FOU]RQX67426.1 putative beta-tubulin cofactor D [Toxoplasma gondii CAST]
MDAIPVSQWQDVPAATGGAARGKTDGLRQQAPSAPALLSEFDQSDDPKYSDASLASDSVCGNVDYFREADSFFKDLAQLKELCESLCEGYARPTEPASNEVYVHRVSVCRVEHAVELVTSCVRVLDRYQNRPTLLDRHIPQIVDPLVQVVQKYLHLISPFCPADELTSTVHRTRSPGEPAPAGLGRRSGGGLKLATKTNCEDEDEQVRRLAASLSLRLILHLVYALCKVRGYKSVQLLLPQRPDLLESVVDLCEILFEAELLYSPSSSSLASTTETERPLSPRCATRGPGEEHVWPADLCTGDANDEAEWSDTCKLSFATRTQTGGRVTREPCFSALRALSALAKQLPLWSTHYSLLVWLSLLVLAPFGLDSLDSSLQSAQERTSFGGAAEVEKTQPRTLGLRIVLLAEAYLRTTNTKASDAAAFALARFFSRPDVSLKTPELLPHFINFCQQSLFLEKQLSTYDVPSSSRTSSCCSSASGSSGRPNDRGDQGEGQSSFAQLSSPVSTGPGGDASPVPLFQRANALRALNEILKIIDRRAVLPELPRLLALLGLAASASDGQPEPGACRPEKDERQMWSSLSSLSALFRKLRCSCAARLCMLLLPPVDNRSLLWRYTPHARCLTALLQQKHTQSKSPKEAEATKETVGEESGEEVREEAERGDSEAEQKRGKADALGPRLEGGEEPDEDVPEEVEEVIGLLLERLSDRDSAVRWTASKSIARVVMQLPKEFADQVVVTVLDSLTSVPLSSSLSSKRLWHGSCLALAELLRRGLVFLPRLAACCSCLRLAVAVEASASCGAGDTIGAAAGAALRDAACYAAWSLARSYYRTEALKAQVESLSHSLLLVALFDREVNCRRAAAAAFQELEGRQGGIPCGLTIVTIADFFALATRRSSYLRVAPRVASLSQDYALLLLHALSTLLLSPHAEEELRVLGAASLKRIAVQYPKLASEEVLSTVLAKAAAPDEDFGTRHGALLGLTALTEALCGGVRNRNGVHSTGGSADSVVRCGVSEDWEGIPEKTQTEIRQLVLKVEKQRQYRGKGGDLIRVAVCKLIQGLAAAPLITFKLATARRYLTTLLDGLRHFSESVQLAAAEALRALLLLRMPTEEIHEFLLPTLVSHLRNRDEHVAARRGYVLALATLPPAVYLACLDSRKALTVPASTEPECSLKGSKDQTQSANGSVANSSEDANGQGKNLPELFSLLCREATSMAPCGQAVLCDAQTRRNALIALGSALAVLLPSSSETRRSDGCSQDREKSGKIVEGTRLEARGAGASCLALSRDVEESERKPESEVDAQHSSPSSLFWPDIVETLERCSADFQADQRGDVGSWVREVAGEIACFLLENACPQTKESVGTGLSRLDLNSATTHSNGVAPARSGAEREMASSAVDSDNHRAGIGGKEGCGTLTREDTLRLLSLLIRMAMENLDRTRSRAAFLLYHMTAPLVSRTEQRQVSRSRIRVSPFRMEWIWGRVFHDYSYELGPADIQPIEDFGSENSEKPAACFLTRALKPSQYPPFLPLLQQCLLPVALQQKRAFEATKPELPFQRLKLSDLPTEIGSAHPSSRVGSETGGTQANATSPLAGASKVSFHRTACAAEEDAGEDSQDSFLTTGGSFDFLLELSVIDGGCATLHKTRKAGVLLRLPLFTNPEITYPRLLPLLLLSPYRRRAAEGVCLGLGAAMGSTADKTAETFLSFLVELRRLSAPSRERATIVEEKEESAEGQRAGAFVGDLSAFYQQVLSQSQGAGEEHMGHAETANTTVTHALVAVLDHCVTELKSGTGTDYLGKLTLAALRAITIVLSNDTVTPGDVSNLLKILTEGPLAKGVWLRSFQLVKSRCEAFVALAGARTSQDSVAEGNREDLSLLKEKRVALCHALAFLLHRFPKIRLLAAESIYSSVLLSLSPEVDCISGVEDANSVARDSPTACTESPVPTSPRSEQLLVLSEKQLDEATELLTLTPWLELNVNSDENMRACSPSELSCRQVNEGKDENKRKSHSGGNEIQCPVERLVVLFSIQNEWATVFFKTDDIHQERKRVLLG